MAVSGVDCPLFARVSSATTPRFGVAGAIAAMAMVKHKAASPLLVSAGQDVLNNAAACSFAYLLSRVLLDVRVQDARDCQHCSRDRTCAMRLCEMRDGMEMVLISRNAVSEKLLQKCVSIVEAVDDVVQASINQSTTCLLQHSLPPAHTEVTVASPPLSFKPTIIPRR